MENARGFKQELVCLLGKPVAENPTQLMIERAFRHHGLDWRYLTIEVDPKELGDAIKGMRAMGFRGGNCTLPHKLAVIQHLDRLGESAALMGAVNCIVRRGASLVGENTDGKGFLSSLRRVADPKGKRVVLLGAGGAARAIAVELALAGVRRIVLVNRDIVRGEEVVRVLKQRLELDVDFVPWRGEFSLPADTELLIQATSIGLFPDVDARVPLRVDSLRPGMVVADVIPNPPLTRLLRDAAARGCIVLDGLGMLVDQGVIGFELWTGVKPEPEVMRSALEEVFGV